MITHRPYRADSIDDQKKELVRADLFWSTLAVCYVCSLALFRNDLSTFV